MTKNGKPRLIEWRRYKHCVPGEKPVVMPSISTVLGCLEKRALYGWHEDMGARGALAAVRMGELDPEIHADDEAVEIVRALKLGAEAAKLKAAKRGLDIHDALEHWGRTGQWPGDRDMDLEHRPFLPGLARALLVLDPEPIAVEQITCSPTHGIAGRFDLLARVDGQITMIDLKTNKWGVGFAEAHPQVAAYAGCEQEIGGVEIERMLVLGIGPDGAFRCDEGCAAFEDFLAVMGAYRSMQRVNNARSALDRMAKAAAA
jgi:hypothetical protein